MPGKSWAERAGEDALQQVSAQQSDTVDAGSVDPSAARAKFGGSKKTSTSSLNSGPTSWIGKNGGSSTGLTKGGSGKSWAERNNPPSSASTSPSAAASNIGAGADDLKTNGSIKAGLHHSASTNSVTQSSGPGKSWAERHLGSASASSSSLQQQQQQQQQQSSAGRLSSKASASSLNGKSWAERNMASAAASPAAASEPQQDSAGSSAVISSPGTGKSWAERNGAAAVEQVVAAPPAESEQNSSSKTPVAAATEQGGKDTEDDEPKGVAAGSNSFRRKLKMFGKQEDTPQPPQQQVKKKKSSKWKSWGRRKAPKELVAQAAEPPKETQEQASSSASEQPSESPAASEAPAAKEEKPAEEKPKKAKTPSLARRIMRSIGRSKGKATAQKLEDKRQKDDIAREKIATENLLETNADVDDTFVQLSVAERLAKTKQKMENSHLYKTKSGSRIDDAVAWVDKELRKLIQHIKEEGTLVGDQYQITFGALFLATENTMEALSGTLKTAKKRQVVEYSGAEVLMQRFHDDVVITLLQEEIPDSTQNDYMREFKAEVDKVDYD